MTNKVVDGYVYDRPVVSTNCPEVENEGSLIPVRGRYYKHGGTSTPNYYVLKRRGDLLPPQHWEQYEKTLHTSEGSYAFTTNGTCYEWFQKCWNVAQSNCPSYDLDTMRGIKEDYRSLMAYHTQSAAAAIYSKGWDALTFLAELKDVIRMFRNLQENLRRIIEDINFRKVSNQYLEYRYGWRTLTYDIEDITKVIHNLEGKRSRYIERSGESITVTDGGTYTSPTWGFDANGGWSSTVSMSYRGSVYADITPPRLQVNPITTAWEVTKLSFVVDWVLNVGQALEALSFLALARKSYAALGANIEVEVTSNILGHTLKNGCDIYEGRSPTSTYHASCRYTYREPTTLSLKPQFQFNLDILKAADLAALIQQRLPRGKRSRRKGKRRRRGPHKRNAPIFYPTRD